MFLCPVFYLGCRRCGCPISAGVYWWSVSFAEGLRSTRGANTRLGVCFKAAGHQAWAGGTSGERRRPDDRWDLGGVSPTQLMIVIISYCLKNKFWLIDWLTRGSEGASWALPVGSRAEPQPKTHFWHIFGSQNTSGRQKNAIFLPSVMRKINIFVWCLWFICL